MGLESAGSSKSELPVMEHGELGTEWGACGSNMAGAEITKIGKHIKTKHIFITKLRKKASIHSLPQLAGAAKFSQLSAAISNMGGLANARDTRSVHHQTCHVRMVVHLHFLFPSSPG